MPLHKIMVTGSALPMMLPKNWKKCRGDEEADVDADDDNRSG